MAFLGLAVPHQIARLLGEIQTPGRKDTDPHLTILHLGDNVPIEVLGKALAATFEVSSQTQPFTVSTSRVACFPQEKPEPGSVPIICRIESDALHTLREKLCASYDAAGIEYSKKFPTFLPHVTLAYADENIEDRRIPTVEWGVGEMVLWGGDEGDRRVVVTFPFSLKLDALSERVASRYLGKFSGSGPPP